VKKSNIFVCLGILLIGIISFPKEFQPDIIPGNGVTRVEMLSDYYEPLEGTNFDTQVFFMDSGIPGATFLLIGGTHPREIAGSTAAIIFIENAKVKSGRVIVIPHANKSATSIPDTYRDFPHLFSFRSKSCIRHLVYGDRRSDPDDQKVEDPEIYIHYPTDQEFEDGAEARNLNRCYPGNPSGNPTEQLAFAIMELIRKEQVDLNLDMHECDTPEVHYDENGNEVMNSGLPYILVCHPKGTKIGLKTVKSLATEEYPLQIEIASFKFRGLSQREIGDNSGCISFLSESPNPGQDRWRDMKTADPITHPIYSLEHRVGLHLLYIEGLVENFNVYENFEKGDIIIENIPTAMELKEKKLGYFLN